MSRLTRLFARLINGPRDPRRWPLPTAGKGSAGTSRGEGGAGASTLEQIAAPPERMADEGAVRLNPAWRSAASHDEQDTSRWIVEPTTGQPIAPRAQPGYYPGFHTLDQQAFWDDATRTLVLDRVNNVPPIRFFREDELPLMQAVVDRLIPQDDREAAYRVPIVPIIDKKLVEDRIPGYRYEDMPPQREAMRLGLRGIEAIAGHMFGKAFVELAPTEQDEVLLTLHDGKPPAGEDIWKQVPAVHFWVQILNDAVEAYYAHPYAWDEIGFGGPAFPRGYFRLNFGEPEPWEVEERRYAWAPPPTARSADDQPIGHGEVRYVPGQAGTH
ncbi:MAG TPA: gluconate 2-dehydrogenase subunit 3 family protein [Chloroflexota bacterium]|nr:gluconate 2-dehydrogenase subunit 3 family protein [Chloroflexota bacterium]